MTFYTLKILIKGKKMQAIEFETEYNNGTIQIPDNYKLNPKSHLKVIILYDDIIRQEPKNYFIEITKKFNEINEGEIDINKIYQKRTQEEIRNVVFN